MRWGQIRAARVPGRQIPGQAKQRATGQVPGRFRDRQNKELLGQAKSSAEPLVGHEPLVGQAKTAAEAGDILSFGGKVFEGVSPAGPVRGGPIEKDWVKAVLNVLLGQNGVFHRRPCPEATWISLGRRSRKAGRDRLRRYAIAFGANYLAVARPVPKLAVF